MKRKSFVLYSDQYGYISDMTDSQLGKLFRMIFDYHINGEVMPDDDPSVAISFKFFKTRFDIDNERYEDACKRNRENGKKHIGRTEQSEQSQSNPVEPSGLSRTQSNPVGYREPGRTQMPLDNDTDNDNERIKDSYPPKKENAISENRNCVQNKFAPGCGNDEFDDVIQLFNSVFKRFAIKPVELDDKRRKWTSTALNLVSGDMATIQSVFDTIAKDTNNRVDPTFDNVMSPHPAFAQYWVKAMLPNQTTKKS